MAALKRLALLLLVVLLPIIGEALSLQLSVRSISSAGGTGLLSVPREYVITSSIALYDGASRESTYFDNVRVTMYASSTLSAGMYEVTVEVNNGGTVYGVTQTVEITTTPTTFIFNLPSRLLQAEGVNVAIYLKRVD